MDLMLALGSLTLGMGQPYLFPRPRMRLSGSEAQVYNGHENRPSTGKVRPSAWHVATAQSVVRMTCRHGRHPRHRLGVLPAHSLVRGEGLRLHTGPWVPSKHQAMQPRPCHRRPCRVCTRRGMWGGAEVSPGQGRARGVKPAMHSEGLSFSGQPAPGSNAALTATCAWADAVRGGWGLLGTGVWLPGSQPSVSGPQS